MSLTKVTYAMIANAAANVVDFGADNTGISSANTAIAAAIAALPSDGGTVFFPSGTYSISAVITVTKSNINFVGEPGARIEITGAAIHNAFEFIACSNIVFNNLRFEWNGAALNLTNPGWENNFALLFNADNSYNSCHDVLIQNCEFVECAAFIVPYVSATQETAIGLDAGKTFYNFSFKNNTATASLTGSEYTSCISAYYLTNYQIIGNVFTFATDSYSVMQLLGAGSVGGGLRYSYDGLITDNLLSGSRYAIFIGAALRILVSNNVLKDFTNESIDFESCEKCAARNNHLSNVKYAFALFYEYIDIEITDNHVEMPSDADYFLNHNPTGSPALSAYGDLFVSGNRATCPDGSVYFQLQNGHHVTVQNNYFQNVIYTAVNNFYSLNILGNTFLWNRNHPTAGTSWKILPADLSTEFQSGVLRICDNLFTASTALNGNCILLYANQAFTNDFFIDRNTFVNLGYPVNYDSAAPNRIYNRTLFRDSIIEGQTAPFAIGGGTATAQFIFSGLVNRTGMSVFADPAAFSTLIGTGGCGLGSTFLRNPPESGQVWGWVNTSSTGSPTWTAIATLP